MPHNLKKRMLRGDFIAERRWGWGGSLLLSQETSNGTGKQSQGVPGKVQVGYLERYLHWKSD